MKKQKEKKPTAPIEFKIKMKEIKVKVKNDSEILQIYDDAWSDIVEIPPGKTVEYVQRLEKVFVPKEN